MATTAPVQSNRFGSIVARLTGVSLLNVVLAFVTSPILARVLGPSGRGEVAAIFAVLGVAPWISELGVTSFLARETARRTREVGRLFGACAPITLAVSLAGVALAVPIAHLLGRGRPVVVDFIEIGLFVLPLSAVTQMLSGVATGEQRWNLLIASRSISSIGSTAAIVALDLGHALTVTSVATTYLVVGLVANLPFVPILRESLPWRFSAPLARVALRFGLHSWLSTVAATGNGYLDQILMAGLVSSRQLGLYALATTLATASGSLVGATSGALFPRVAAGDYELAGRACRVTLLLVAS